MKAAGARTRPSMRWALDRGVVTRALMSVVSTAENRAVALDASDVATGVAAIRDQGGSKMFPKLFSAHA